MNPAKHLFETVKCKFYINIHKLWIEVSMVKSLLQSMYVTMSRITLKPQWDGRQSTVL